MSLQAIGNLRRGGQRPAVTFVVIGPKPEHVFDDWRVVLVGPNDDPRRMDWRPCVGLLVAVFTTKPDPAKTIVVLEELQEAGATLFGAVDQTGVYPLLVDSDDEHEQCLKKAWSVLCQS